MQGVAQIDRMLAEAEPTPSRTTTAEAVLGMLSLRPMSGYELRQSIAGSIGNFWNESFGQIYPTLKRLEADGSIESVPGPADEKMRNGTPYRLTASGRDRLEAWLGIPARPRPPRNELLLKVFFGNLIDLAETRAQVQAAQAEAAVSLARYKNIRKQTERIYAQHPALPFWLFTLRYGQLEAKSHLRWAEETLLELDRLEASATAHKGRETHHAR